MIKSLQESNTREAFAKVDKDWCRSRKTYLLLYSPLILCCDVSKFHPIMMGQITARDTEAARWGNVSIRAPRCQPEDNSPSLPDDAEPYRQMFGSSFDLIRGADTRHIIWIGADDLCGRRG